MSAATLSTLVGDLLNGRIKVVDLTQTLSPDFPTLELPPQFGQCAPLKVERHRLVLRLEGDCAALAGERVSSRLKHLARLVGREPVVVAR